jgi:hypothetical protein
MDGTLVWGDVVVRQRMGLLNRMVDTAVMGKLIDRLR